jgi:hypothetical protein
LANRWPMLGMQVDLIGVITIAPRTRGRSGTWGCCEHPLTLHRSQEVAGAWHESGR